MSQIISLRKPENYQPINFLKTNTSEEWIVKKEDRIEIKLLAKELNTCDIAFYYNNEKLGSYLIQDLSMLSLHPYTKIKANGQIVNDTQIFFNMALSRFKVLKKIFQIISNLYVTFTFI